MPPRSHPASRQDATRFINVSFVPLPLSIAYRRRWRLKWPAMAATNRSPSELLDQTAAQLREAMAELSGQLRPFPSFLGMISVQAIELEPPPDSDAKWGCVVVLPDGEICELELEVIPGPSGPADVDQVEKYKPLDLPAEDYIHFAAAALRLMGRELSRRR